MKDIDKFAEEIEKVTKELGVKCIEHTYRKFMATVIDDDGEHRIFIDIKVKE